MDQTRWGCLRGDIIVILLDIIFQELPLAYLCYLEHHAQHTGQVWAEVVVPVHLLPSEAGVHLYSVGHPGNLEQLIVIN